MQYIADLQKEKDTVLHEHHAAVTALERRVSTDKVALKESFGASLNTLKAEADDRYVNEKSPSQ